MVKDMGFAEMMKDLITDRLGDGYEVSVREVTKNNGTVLSGLTITKEDVPVAPTIYLELMEEAFEKGELSVTAAVNSIVRTYAEHSISEKPEFLNGLDAEKIYSYVLPKVINADRNREFLNGVPHAEFLDLAIVYLYHVEVRGLPGNINITNKFAQNFGLEPEKLHTRSIENLKRSGLEMMELANLIASLTGNDEIGEELSGAHKMYVFTNGSRFNGAACMVNPECFVELSERYACDLFLLPSSVHELIVIPDCDKINVSELRAMVRSVNETEVSNEDFLSNSVYVFDHKEKQLRIA